MKGNNKPEFNKALEVPAKRTLGILTPSLSIRNSTRTSPSPKRGTAHNPKEVSGEQSDAELHLSELVSKTDLGLRQNSSEVSFAEVAGNFTL